MNWFYKLTGFKKDDRTLITAFILVTLLFFFWAFVHNINGILIPHLRKSLQLSDTRSSFIDVAIYLAYFLAALPAGWLIQKKGYRFTILLGLCLFAAGAFMFIPAAASRTYMIFLLALFIFGFGAACLETAANPYISGLGSPAHSTPRLNFAQSFNGVGAVLTPIIASGLILSGVSYTDAELAAMPVAERETFFQGEANSVMLPYGILGAVILLMIFLFWRHRIPEQKTEATASVTKGFSGISRYKHLWAAVAAQFLYVGAQVGVTSFFVKFCTTADPAMNEKKAGYLLGSVAMVGFMIGRFAGTFLMRIVSPVRLLFVFSMISALLLLFALNSKGHTAAYCLMAVPFFMSIMFPTIFDLGIKDTGAHARAGASLIIMSIAGGAVIPYVMGRISDHYRTIMPAYYVPIACFIAVAVFAVLYPQLHYLSQKRKT
jgi:MFS transporter, FHS family, L-fucose permease